MTKIYTKTGDRGQTGLIGGRRVGKDSPRIEAYGDVDELNSVLGMALGILHQGFMPDAHAQRLGAMIESLQNELFELGSQLATPPNGVSGASPVISSQDCVRMEEWIDGLESELPPLSRFILPGGHVLPATLHLARSVCRRAERRCVALSKTEYVAGEALAYLNRLSDLLFVCARWAQMKLGVEEKPWTARKK